MPKKYTNEMLQLFRNIQNIDYIVPEEIPNIDLYMDQITTFMNEHLQSSKRFPEDKILTKTMINNYTKNNLLPPPDKKKYSQEHMLLLIYIYYLKNFLSISDIQSILGPLTERFFHQENGIQLQDIYSEIVKLEKENINPQTRDIIRKLKKSNECFQDVSNPEDKELLSTFAFICMLSFDVWVKKNIIENIIDGTLGDRNKAAKNAAKSSSSKKTSSKGDGANTTASASKADASSNKKSKSPNS